MKAAIIISFRSTPDGERDKELGICISSIRNLCNKYKRDYKIYVMIQDNDKPLFNKTILMNAGAAVSNKECDYFIYHDVDNLVSVISDAYRPREYSGNIGRVVNGQKFKDTDEHWGDIFFMKKEDFFAIDGLCPLFWSWGYETSHWTTKLRDKRIKTKRGDAEIIHMVHDTKHRFHGNPNLVNNAIVMYYLDIPFVWGYSNTEYTIIKTEEKANDLVYYYITFPDPPYELNVPMSMDKIREMGGNPTQEGYDYILKTYYKK